MPYTYPVTIHHLYLSPGHNYFGNKGDRPGPHPTHDVDAVAVKAGAGLVGAGLSVGSSAESHDPTAQAIKMAIAHSSRGCAIGNLHPGSGEARRRDAPLALIVDRRTTIGDIERGPPTVGSKCFLY